MNAARPPAGVHTAAEGEGTPASAANGASAEPMGRLRGLGGAFSGSGGGGAERARPGRGGPGRGGGGKPGRAIRGVSLQVRRGEVLALIGESGWGKSVTMRPLLRLPPERRTRIDGLVEVASRAVLALSQRE